MTTTRDVTCDYYLLKRFIFSPQAGKKNIGFKPGGYSLAAGVKGARNISEVNDYYIIYTLSLLVFHFHFSPILIFVVTLL